MISSNVSNSYVLATALHVHVHITHLYVDETELLLWPIQNCKQLITRVVHVSLCRGLQSEHGCGQRCSLPTQAGMSIYFDQAYDNF